MTGEGRVKSEERAQHSGCCPESVMLCPYKHEGGRGTAEGKAKSGHNMLCPYRAEGGRELSDAILWLGRSIGCVAKKLQQAVSFGSAGAFLEKWQRPASTVDVQPVLPNHAAALLPGGIFRLKRQFFLHELLKVVFDRQTLGRSKGCERGGDFGF